MNDQTHRVFHDIPIGIRAAGLRHETDSMGEIEVPADRYWGVQTQRSLVHFAIGDDRMPSVFITPMAMSRKRRRWSMPPWPAAAVEGGRHRTRR
jgi:hypothetical protein